MLIGIWEVVVLKGVWCNSYLATVWNFDSSTAFVFISMLLTACGWDWYLKSHLHSYCLKLSAVSLTRLSKCKQGAYHGRWRVEVMRTFLAWITHLSLGVNISISFGAMILPDVETKTMSYSAYEQIIAVYLSAASSCLGIQSFLWLSVTLPVLFYTKYPSWLDTLLCHLLKIFETSIARGE